MCPASSDNVQPMNYRRSDLVFYSPLVRVFDVSCHAPQSGYGGEEWCSTTQIIIPRRGVFMLNHHGAPIIADPNTALILGIGDTYQISHPVDGGDQCTVLVFRPELVEEALGSVEARHGIIQATTQLNIHVLTHLIVTRMADQLNAEENSVFVLNALARDFSNSMGWSSMSESQKQRVEEVRALLASQPTEAWNLESIARTVYCSPFYLARQFRVITGESISRYLLRLRLALALDRLAQGEANLARLAVELRFANHSHFSARFKSVFGTTPAALRSTLTRKRFQKMSKILTAKPLTRC
jgi:AraC family transcriptional regulator